MPPIPKSMSGILIEENGGPEQLHWKTDLPVPELKDGEVLIRNEFIGVNYIDTLVPPFQHDHHPHPTQPSPQPTHFCPPD